MGLARVRERFSIGGSAAHPHSPRELQMGGHGCLKVRSRLEMESMVVVNLGMLTGEASTASRECFVSGLRYRKCVLKELYTGKCCHNTNDAAENDGLHIGT